VRGPVGGPEPQGDYRFLNEEHIAGYTAFCRENLAALLDGGTPRATPRRTCRTPRSADWC